MESSGSYLAVIKVVGVGGGGTNAVNRMVDAGLRGVEFIAANTDAQALQMCDADIKLNIGHDLTKGLGAGRQPGVGFGAAAESRDDIKEALKGADMVFVTAGEGGGTGTGAAPGHRRDRQERDRRADRRRRHEAVRVRGHAADAPGRGGHPRLREVVDTLIVIPNEKLLTIVERRTTILEAFREADNVLRQGVQGITDLITIPGLINLDFADVRTIMHDAGSALMGIGTSGGENRAAEAAKRRSRARCSRSPSRARPASCSTSPAAATRPVRGQRGGRDRPGAPPTRTRTSSSASVIDEQMGDEIRVTVIATGFDHGARARAPRARRRATARAAATAARASATRAHVARDRRRRDRHPAVPARPLRRGGGSKATEPHRSGRWRPLAARASWLTPVGSVICCR
jgi:cell division protein FtsZ